MNKVISTLAFPADIDIIQTQAVASSSLSIRTEGIIPGFCVPSRA